MSDRVIKFSTEEGNETYIEEISISDADTELFPADQFSIYEEDVNSFTLSINNQDDQTSCQIELTDEGLIQLTAAMNKLVGQVLQYRKPTTEKVKQL